MYDIVKQKVFDLSHTAKDNLVGYTHDRAKALIGEEIGLKGLLESNLKQKFMDLPDPCHSLNLTLSQSWDQLPDDITGFVDDIHNHFASSQRREYLTKIQIEKGCQVLSVRHFVETRWLSLGLSLERLLLIWDSLIHYMKAKPKFPGVKAATYNGFLKLLQNKAFHLKIVFLAKILGIMNETNIIFQNQKLEIHLLKFHIHKVFQEIAKILIPFRDLPQNIDGFQKTEWEIIIQQKDKFRTEKSYINTLVTDLDSSFAALEKFGQSNKEDFVKISQSFLSSLLKLCLKFLPLDDKTIDTLDFVTLHLEEEDLKEKILSFNKEFDIVSQEKVPEITKEISRIMDEKIVFLKKQAKGSALYLWDLIRQTGSQDENGETIYKHLSKILKIAHALPTSSSGVEQSFSTVKLVRSALRNSLKEETLQSLLLIHQEYKNKTICFDDDFIKLFDKFKSQLTLNNDNKQLITIDLNNDANKENGTESKPLLPDSASSNNGMKETSKKRKADQMELEGMSDSLKKMKSGDVMSESFEKEGDVIQDNEDGEDQLGEDEDEDEEDEYDDVKGDNDVRDSEDGGDGDSGDGNGDNREGEKQQ